MCVSSCLKQPSLTLNRRAPLVLPQPNAQRFPSKPETSVGCLKAKKVSLNLIILPFNFRGISYVEPVSAPTHFMSLLVPALAVVTPGEIRLIRLDSVVMAKNSAYSEDILLNKLQFDLTKCVLVQLFGLALTDSLIKKCRSRCLI